MNGSLLFIIVSVVSLVLAIIIHEVAHGYVADRLGDPTARLMGRLTLNPLPHIDPIGSIILPLILITSGSPVLFGWAKPVPIDIFNLKNPRRDAALISLAGPGINLVLAIICSILLRVIAIFPPSTLTVVGIFFLAGFLRVNIVLGIFNLLPIHPLDGFKIVGGFLSDEKAREWYSLERYGYIFLILMLMPLGRSSMFDMLVSPVISFATNLLFPSSILPQII